MEIGSRRQQGYDALSRKLRCINGSREQKIQITCKINQCGSNWNEDKKENKPKKENESAVGWTTHLKYLNEKENKIHKFVIKSDTKKS